MDIQTLLDQTGRIVIDGSMSTALEQLGADLNCSLWTARSLANTPELVRQVHLNYFRAGADCGITCSYQATIRGLTENGFTHEQAREIITRSVAVFRDARDEWWAAEGKPQGRAWPLCLAGVGPYGAYLADGSEYRGRYAISDEALYAFHKERAELLWQAGADLLLFETQPSLGEALIEARIAEEMGADYIVSFSCMDDLHTNEGQPVRECAETLSKGHPHLRMIGVNCTRPEYIVSLIHELRRGCDLPIAVYPNSGETYDPETKTWHGSGLGRRFEDYALDYFRAGASAVGGCCTTIYAHVEQVVRARETYLSMGAPKDIAKA